MMTNNDKNEAIRITTLMIAVILSENYTKKNLIGGIERIQQIIQKQEVTYENNT